MGVDESIRSASPRPAIGLAIKVPKCVGDAFDPKVELLTRRRHGGNGNGGGSRSARLSVAARDLLTQLPLLSSFLEQIIQGRIHPSLVNVAPQRAIGSNDPISADPSRPRRR